MIRPKKLNLLKMRTVMGAAKKLDKEINQYLALLSDRQKEAVLTVIKTFAQEEEGTSEYSDDFKKELDCRYEEYKNGGELISEAEAKKRIEGIINAKARK
jgi:hypothetical protein